MFGLTYFKRYRMEIELRGALPPIPELPDGFFFLPWDDGLLARHAEVKYHAFAEELDTTVFPSLGSRDGCLQLMEAIRFRAGFLPGATWLIASGLDYCGTIQGVRDASGVGAIQNVGVVPEHRGRGLASALLTQALHGFKLAGVHKAMLEVTARNSAALDLYRRLGFRARRTVYKPIQLEIPAVADPVMAR